jgi:hypothetical protein
MWGIDFFVVTEGGEGKAAAWDVAESCAPNSDEASPKEALFGRDIDRTGGPLTTAV